MVKSPAANAGDVGDMGSIPGSGGFPGVGYGDPQHCFGLENSMGSRPWWAIVRGVAESWA